MKAENTPSKTIITPGQEIKLTTRFGSCSRGKSWGRYYPNQTRATGEFSWVEKCAGGSTLLLTGPGYYVVGSDDGFSRKARGEFVLTAA
jgi:hypothetical protein